MHRLRSANVKILQSVALTAAAGAAGGGHRTARIPGFVNSIRFALKSAPSACLNAFLLTPKLARMSSGGVSSSTASVPPAAVSAAITCSVSGATRW